MNGVNSSSVNYPPTRLDQAKSWLAVCSKFIAVAGTVLYAGYWLGERESKYVMSEQLNSFKKNELQYIAEINSHKGDIKDLEAAIKDYKNRIASLEAERDRWRDSTEKLVVAINSSNDEIGLLNKKVASVNKCAFIQEQIVYISSTISSKRSSLQLNLGERLTVVRMGEIESLEKQLSNIQLRLDSCDR